MLSCRTYVIQPHHPWENGNFQPKADWLAHTSTGIVELLFVLHEVSYIMELNLK
jgi:hypothetical protein